MTRDEVLERLDRMEAETSRQMVLMEGSGHWPIAASLRVDAEVFRAAAKIIRESGKVAEALGEIVSCEPIDNDPVHKRIKYVEVQIHRADMDRYRKIVADYFVPAPPAREVEND